MSLNINTLISYKQSATFLLLGSNQTVRITDCQTIWNINPEMCFHTGYRFVGTVAQIRKAMVDIGRANETEAILNSLLTKQNYNTTFNSIYVQEQNDYYLVMSSLLPSSQSQSTLPILPMAINFTRKHNMAPTNNQRKRKETNNEPTLIDYNANAKVINVITTHDTPFAPDPDGFEDLFPELDSFDFQTYQDDFLLLSQYYDGIELYIKLSNWIMYKYGELKTEREREALMADMQFSDVANQIPRGDTKDWLDKMTGIFEGEQLLYSWYKHFKPHLLPKVHIFYEKWGYNLAGLMNKLYRMYIDEDHEDIDLWF